MCASYYGCLFFIGLQCGLHRARQARLKALALRVEVVDVEASCHPVWKRWASSWTIREQWLLGVLRSDLHGLPPGALRALTPMLRALLAVGATCHPGLPHSTLSRTARTLPPCGLPSLPLMAWPLAGRRSRESLPSLGVPCGWPHLGRSHLGSGCGLPQPSSFHRGVGPWCPNPPSGWH